jgi:hypothetical protein
MPVAPWTETLERHPGQRIRVYAATFAARPVYLRQIDSGGCAKSLGAGQRARSRAAICISACQSAAPAEAIPRGAKFRDLLIEIGCHAPPLVS